jgi:class 3 adenylate cyclase
VNWTGDGIFAAFGSTRPALQGAIAIQRALAAHADSTGFAPPVRIGVHTADATQRGDDFSGIGVHVAARIAALAGGGEILVSGDALADAPDVTAGDAREVEVRGVSMPIRVAALPWG